MNDMAITRRKKEQDEDNYIILIDQPWFVVLVDDVHITLRQGKML